MLNNTSSFSESYSSLSEESVFIVTRQSKFSERWKRQNWKQKLKWNCHLGRMPSLSSKMLRAYRTVNLFTVAFAIGLFVAVTGPTLIDLESIIGVSAEQISYIYPARSAGWLIGSIVGGLLIDYFINRQAFFFMAIFVTAATAAVTPWCSSLLSLTATMIIAGVAMGSLMTGSNVWCLDLWGKRSGPFLQALHFAFALGTCISPLIAEPFLSSNKVLCSNTSTEALVNSSLIDDDATLNLSLHFSVDALYNEDTLQNEGLGNEPSFVWYVYTIISGYTFAVGLSFLVLFAVEPKEQSTTEERKEQAQKFDLKLTITVLFLTSTFIFLKCGVENAYAQLLTTFVVIGNLKLSKSMGSFMTSLFWGTFTLGRGFSIFFADRLSASCMVIIDLALMVLASIILVFFGNTLKEFLWIGSGILGIGLASAFASTTLWLEEYVVITNMVSSILASAAAVGQMTLPFLVGHYIEENPMILMYAILSSSCTGCVFFLSAWWIAKHYMTHPPASHDLSVKM